jgi:FkbM family methyltransferase
MYYGQFQTDKFIDEYFDPNHVGVCFEIGACDGFIGTNTYYFEQKGWECICVEPNPHYFENLKINRKISLNYACGSENIDDQEFTIFDLGNNQSAISSLSVDQRLVDSHTHLIKNNFTTKVNVRTLDFILDELKFDKKIDFLSIDTEGTEIEVLKGFDIKKWKPKLLVIENNFNDPEIEKYLSTFGYIKNKRIEVNDFYILN